MKAHLKSAWYFDCPSCGHRGFTAGVPASESTNETQELIDHSRDTLRRVVEQSAIIEGATAEMAQDILDEVEANAETAPWHPPAEVTCMNCLETFDAVEDE